MAEETPEEIQKRAKTIVNMDRFDLFVNGSNTTVVPTDNGQVPALANLAKTLQDNFLSGLSGDISQKVNATQKGLEALFGVPLAVPIAGNVNNLFVETGTVVNGTTFEAYICATNTALPFITADGKKFRVTNGFQELGAGSLVRGRIAKFTYSQGGVAFVLNSTRPAVVATGNVTDPNDITTNASFIDTTTNAKAARKALEGIFGYRIGMPYNGNPNRIIVEDAPSPSDQSTFDVLISATNTGGVTMVYGGQDRALTNNPGTGSPMSAGQLVAGKIATFQVSYGGGVFIWKGNKDVPLGTGTGGTPTPTPTPTASYPIGNQDVNLTNDVWGQVSFATGTRVVTPYQKKFIVAGSSNANSSYVAAGAVPFDVIRAALDKYQPGTGIEWGGDNVPVQGAPFSAAGGQLNGAASFLAGTAKWAFLFFWMNDCRTIFYHDYGGFWAQIGAMKSTCTSLRNKGIEPVLMTGFHPDPRASGSALDPFYYPNSNTGMAYPAGKAAPIDPNNDMYPPANDFMQVLDRTGGGRARTGFKRIDHWNEAILAYAASAEIAVLDLAYSTQRNCIEPLPDLDSGLSKYFASGNPLHPLKPLYDEGVTPVLEEFCYHAMQGRHDKLIFRGDTF